MTEKYIVRAHGGGFAVVAAETDEFINLFKVWADAYHYALQLNMLHETPAILKQLRSRND